MNYNDEFEDISSSSSEENGFRISKLAEQTLKEEKQSNFSVNNNDLFVFEGEQTMAQTKSEKTVSLSKFNNSKAKRKAKRRLLCVKS